LPRNLKSLSEKPCSTDQAENRDKDCPSLDDLRPHNHVVLDKYFGAIYPTVILVSAS
jgi:hypothetical protein